MVPRKGLSLGDDNINKNRILRSYHAAHVYHSGVLKIHLKLPFTLGLSSIYFQSRAWSARYGSAFA